MIYHIQYIAVCLILSLVLCFCNRKLRHYDTHRLFEQICAVNAFSCILLISAFCVPVLSRVSIILYTACLVVIVLLWLKYSDKVKELVIIFVPFIVAAICESVLSEPAFLLPFAPVFPVIILFIKEQNNRLITDSLTKLPNRYGLDAEIEEQLEQYEKDKTDSFYVIVCDMDNFKHINDTWGHLEGDRALKMISETLTRVAKDFNSTAFRFGGDEFVIITDKSDDGLGEKICEKVKGELDKLNFRDDFAIRMSMGVALYDGTKTISELIEGADRELYEEKKQKN